MRPPAARSERPAPTRSRHTKPSHEAVAVDDERLAQPVGLVRRSGTWRPACSQAAGSRCGGSPAPISGRPFATCGYWTTPLGAAFVDRPLRRKSLSLTRRSRNQIQYLHHDRAFTQVGPDRPTGPKRKSYCTFLSTSLLMDRISILPCSTGRPNKARLATILDCSCSASFGIVR